MNEQFLRIIQDIARRTLINILGASLTATGEVDLPTPGLKFYLVTSFY